MGSRIECPIIVENFETGDHRLISEVSFRDLPLTLRHVQQDVGAHQGATAVGVLESVRKADDQWFGTIEYLDDDPRVPAAGVAAALADKGAQFISADPGGRVEYHFSIVEQGTGRQVEYAEVEEAYDKIWLGTDDADEAQAWLQTLYELQTFDHYEVGGVTQVDIPAFAQCRIPGGFLSGAAPAAEGVEAPVAARAAEVDGTSLKTKSAQRLLRRLAAGPATRPAAFYQRHDLLRYTELTVTDDGQIIGHFAPWNGCHRGFQNACERPPYQTDFPDFHTGEVALDDGSRMRVGVITHIEGHLNTAAEYDKLASDPACQLGSVRLYADKWGIQACGSVHPDVTPEEITRALAGRPSGDWRGPASARKLFAIAMVNTPGYTGYTEEAEGSVVRMVAAIPPPPPGEMQPPMDQVFFDAPPSVITAACACNASAEVEHDDGGSGCGCGGHEGACSCDDAPKLTARDIADLADLDRAMKAMKATQGVKV
jgi:hypothetical protein